MNINNDELYQRFQKSNYIFYSFSGGRDSALALYCTIDKYRNTGKHIEALFVDSGDEFPDLLEHVKYVCDFLNVKLTVLHGDNFIKIYGEKQQFPDSIHMDCIERLINKPIDAYCKSVCGAEDYVLIRGGKSTQKRPESNTKLLHQLKSKPQMIIYNPLYEIDINNIDANVIEKLTWSGYAKGFLRTACWCCPFQKPQQWAQLKKYYPELHDKLKIMFAKYDFILHPGDGHVKYIADYWIKEEMTPVKFKYCKKRENELRSIEIES